jgi:hypothetical protein
MTMQIIESMMPEEKPVWAQVLMAALENLQDVGEKFLKAGTGAPPDPRQLSAGPPNGHAMPAPQPQPMPQPRIADPVANDVRTLLMPQLPPSFRTPEWEGVIIALAKHAPVPTVVDKLAGHLQHLIETDTVPAEIGVLREEPEDALDSLVRPLMTPLGMKPAYAEEILVGVLTRLSQAGLVDWTAVDESDESDDESEVAEEGFGAESAEA